MATRAEQARAEAERESAQRRAAHPTAGPNKSQRLREATAKSPKGRSLHAATKLQGDAKAGKPDPGRIEGFWKTGNNGGEDQTVNGVAAGRGADGAASVQKASRKSTRGRRPAGEKGAQLGREQIRRVVSPEMRAARGK